MKKVEELSELLIDELDQFNNNIKKLNLISTNLKETKVEVNLSDIELLLAKYVSSQELTINSSIRQFDKLNSKLSKSNIYPRSFLIIFTCFALVSSLILWFCIYNLRKIPEYKYNAYNEGKTKMITHFSSFLEENKRSEKAYNK